MLLPCWHMYMYMYMYMYMCRYDTVISMLLPCWYRNDMTDIKYAVHRTVSMAVQLVRVIDQGFTLGVRG